MRTLDIGNTRVSHTDPAYVVAEIGNNHGGSADQAKRLIDLAAQAGAHAVKFQRRHNRTLYTQVYYDRPYTGSQSFGPTYGAHREALELPDRAWGPLAEHANALGVDVLATPFDLDSLRFLVDIGVPAIKIASALITHTPLLEAAAETDKPVIVSTGGASPDDIDRAVEIVGRDRIALLHCTAVYPTADEDVYLGAIEDLRQVYPDVIVGYSNHSARGVLFPTAAYCYGARIIEVHFTHDRAAKGTDHAMSLEPQGLAKLTSYLQRLHVGCRHNKPQLDAEKAALTKMAQSLYWRTALSPGHVISPEDLVTKSPGEGLPPYRLPDLVGSTLAVEVMAEQLASTGVLS